MTDDKAHLTKLVRNYYARLRVLESQSALRGINTSPEIAIEIEDIREEILRIQALLDNGENEKNTQSGGVNFGSGNIIGQLGDIVQGDKVATTTSGTIQGTVVGVNYGTIDIVPQKQPVRQEDVDDMLELLSLHRQTLSIYLKQRALQGAAYSAPQVTNGIREAREGIQRCKSILRGWSISIEDLPVDNPQ